jgi:hypothetical protein
VKRFHLPTDPKKRRQLVMVLAVGVLVLVYLRSRRSSAAAAAASTSTDPQLSTDGTSAATGPFAPDWPTTGNDLTGFGLGGSGGGGSGGSTGSTGPAAGTGGASKKKHRSGYAAWLKAHPDATRAQRIAALRRLIAQGRGNLSREAGILATLSRRQGAAREDRNDPPPHQGGGGKKPPPPTLHPPILVHPVLGHGPIVVHATPAVAPRGAGIALRPSSGIAVAARAPQVAPISTRQLPRRRVDNRKRTLGVR